MLAACANNPPQLAGAPPPVPKVEHESCYQELDADGVTYQRQRDFHEENGCGIDHNVKVDKSPIPLSRPALMNCSFAATLAEFEIRIVRPAAMRILHKQVTQVAHVGTYNCRGERGGDASRLSQHAYGKAIDIIGFEVEGGERISVSKDWHGSDAKAQFLHEVAKGACSIFDVVITPNHNSFHSDHIHVDIGPYKFCGI
jgi:hypothetical protein